MAATSHDPPSLAIWEASAVTQQTPRPTPPPRRTQPPASQAPEALAEALAPQLALVRAVAATGQLTRAAHRVGIPQPTASRWLAALGRQLGTPIIARAGRGIELTRAGQHLADAADRALAEWENGCRRALEEADPDRGLVVFAFLHTMGGVQVPELLRGFRARHPQVRFSLVQAAHEVMVRRVRGGEVDLALTSPPPQDTDGLAVAVLFRQPIVLVAPSGHRLASRASVRVAQLASERFVGLKPGYGMRQITDELCQAAGFTPVLAFEGEEVDTVRGLVAAGLGVALVPADPQPTHAAGSVEVPITPVAYREVALVWSTERPVAPAVRAFRDFAVRR